MKKLLSTSILLAALAGTASAAPYVLPSNQTGALTANDVQPVYSIDFQAAFADDSDDPDMYGPRISFNLYNDLEGDFLHQFSLNVAALWGSESDSFTEFDGVYLYTYDYDIDAFMLPITLGYDLNIRCVDKLFFYVGGKAGIAMCKVEVPGYDDTDWGFTWSVGAGFKYYFSDQVYARLGYEFSRTYLDFDGIGSANIGQHSLIVGVGCRF